MPPLFGGDRLDYMREINAFYDRLETNPLATSSIVLWHALMHIANKAGWPGKFAVATSVLELKTGLKRDTIFHARNKLQQAGLVDWNSRKGNQSAEYVLISIARKFESNKSTQYPTQHTTQCPTQHTTQCPTINRLDNTRGDVVVRGANENDDYPSEMCDLDFVALQKAYAAEINDGREPNVATQRKLAELCTLLPAAVLVEVVSEASETAKNGNSCFRHVEAIAQAWKNEGLDSIEKALQRREERKSKAAKNSNSQPERLDLGWSHNIREATT